MFSTREPRYSRFFGETKKKWLVWLQPDCDIICSWIEVGGSRSCVILFQLTRNGACPLNENNVAFGDKTATKKGLTCSLFLDFFPGKFTVFTNVCIIYCLWSWQRPLGLHWALLIMKRPYFALTILCFSFFPRRLSCKSDILTRTDHGWWVPVKIWLLLLICREKRTQTVGQYWFRIVAFCC